MPIKPEPSDAIDAKEVEEVGRAVDLLIRLYGDNALRQARRIEAMSKSALAAPIRRRLEKIEHEGGTGGTAPS